MFSTKMAPCQMQDWKIKSKPRIVLFQKARKFSKTIGYVKMEFLMQNLGQFEYHKNNDSNYIILDK